MKHLSLPSITIPALLCSVFLFDQAFAATEGNNNLGKISRKLTCYERGDFRICPGPGLYYPGYSKNISTILFGRAVVINYVPVFVDEAGNEYLDDGSNVPDKKDTNVYTLTKLNVLFDFGQEDVFVLPVKLGSELQWGDVSLDQICEVVLFTDFLGEFTANWYGDDGDIKKGAVEVKKEDSSVVQIFDDIVLLSPFDPFILGVMRHFMNNPKERNLILKAVRSIEVDADDDTEKAKPYPVYVHGGKHYLNLAAYQLPEDLAKPDSEYSCKASKTYYKQDEKYKDGSRNSEELVRKFVGEHVVEYDGSAYIKPSTIRVSEEVAVSSANNSESAHYQSTYGLDIGEIELLPEGLEYMKSRSAEVLAIAKAQELWAEADKEKTRNLRTQKMTEYSGVREPNSYKDFRSSPADSDEIITTVDGVLAGWSDYIQKKVKEALSDLEIPMIIPIGTRMMVKHVFTNQELFNPCWISSSVNK